LTLVDKSGTIVGMLGTSSHVWFWQTPSWNWAELWALLVLLALSSVPIEVPKKAAEGSGKKTAGLFVALLNGRDGRWSTSKAGAVLWTYAVWFVFIATLLHTNGKGVEHAILKQQYLVLMGIPIAAAVVAKGLTQSKVESGKIATKAPDGIETKTADGIGQLVTDDSGQPDLLDFQYFGFNLILLGYFFTRFLGHQDLGLPDLPDSLVALSGVSAAGYLGKKGLQRDTDPVITAIDEQSAEAGQTIRIHGTNFATANDQTVRVEVAGRIVAGANLTVGDNDTTVEAAIPAGVPPGPAEVRVINSRGAKSSSKTITITAP
jgi:hypothetical protein